LFDAPVRRSGLAARVVGASATEADIGRALSGAALGFFVQEREGYICLRSSNSAETIQSAKRRADETRALLDRHQDILAFVRSLRVVRLAALSGGCAHDAADDGDIDIFMVTRRNALWRTLLCSTIVSKARGWRRVLCMNYLVDETAQGLPWRDFYGAFELISLKPLGEEQGTADLLDANPWVKPIFPNFLPARNSGQNPPNQKNDASGGSLLEAAARMIQRPYLRYRLPPSTGVELSDHVVRLHTTDHRTRLRALFQDALQRIGMEAPPWI
jgi:hypothetical protein